MMMPEIRRQQWEKGDGQQHAGERDAAPKGEHLPKIGMAVFLVGRSRIV
jgi:hypothetical protein